MIMDTMKVLSSVGIQTSAITLAMAGTEDWWR